MKGEQDMTYRAPCLFSQWTWLKSLRDNYVSNGEVRVQVASNLPDALGLGYCAVLNEDERLGRLRKSEEFFRIRWKICLMFYG